MTENQAREIIYAAVVAAWTPAPAVDLVFDNEVYDTTGKTEWARAVVHHTGGGQRTMSEAPNRRFRWTGLLVVQLFVALDKGMQRMDQLARLLVNGLDSKVINDVWFLSHEYQEGGGGDGYRRGTVNIPFTYDEVR